MIRMMMILIGVLAFATSVSAAEVQVGESVLAFWDGNEAYFVGTVVEKRGADFFIVFEDGDTAVVAGDKIRKNDLKVDSKVLALWTDGSYYPGTIAKIVGRALYIHYDDGDKGWVAWSGIAIK